MDLTIEKISPRAEEVQELFRLLDEHNLSYCPPEICHLTQADELEAIDATLIGLFVNSDLASIGGLKFFDGYAEVTRMFTREEYRGKGLSKMVLNALENIALEKGCSWLRLETSEKFTSAVALYNKMGFQRCKPFGEYVSKAYNTYMEKELRRGS